MILEKIVWVEVSSMILRIRLEENSDKNREIVKKHGFKEMQDSYGKLFFEGEESYLSFIENEGISFKEFVISP